jgi:uncharacterized protein (DUF1501 family)
MNRRSFLRAGIAGVGSLTLPELLRRRAEAAEKTTARRTAVILVWLPGGPSHLETYDPKPAASSEYRGPFSPIATSAPGVHICELLPLHARVADKFAILRSMVHTGFCHQQGTQQLLTGHPVLDLKQKPDHPDLLAVANRLRFDPARAIPNYVGVPQVNYSGSAYLGPAYEPFDVNGDPNDPNFSVPNIGLGDRAQLSRIGERISLRKKFDRLRRDVDVAATMEALDTFELQAWNMLTSSVAREAFDLGREGDTTRDRYGRNRWGQQCLLARRLVEAGVELVTVQLAGTLCGRVGNWDDHAVNHNVFEGMKYRAPFFDQAVSALIEDVYARGLDKKVMIVVSGEFGRTPKISHVASSGKGVASADAGVVQPGRDHWPRATSILFSGGGIATGQVIGATDVRGEDVIDRRVGRGDFLATMYRHLGIDPDGISFPDFAGRPIPILPEGSPIPELLA